METAIFVTGCLIIAIAVTPLARQLGRLCADLSFKLSNLKEK